VLSHHRGRPELRRPSLLLLLLLAIQITLGALTVLSGKHYVINSLHVVTGAMVLGTSLVLTLRACRPRFAGSEEQDPAYVRGAGATERTRRSAGRGADPIGGIRGAGAAQRTRRSAGARA
jgi:hypothetical protein